MIDNVWVDSRYNDGAPGCVLVGVAGGGGGEGVLLGAQQAGAGGQSSAEEEGRKYDECMLLLIECHLLTPAR